MAEKEEAVKNAATENKTADAEAKKKADADAKKKADAEAKKKAADDAKTKADAEANAKAKADADAKANKPKKVRVICKGTLGPKLLKKGDVTDDPEYVALLETERGRTLVEEVK